MKKENSTNLQKYSGIEVECKDYAQDDSKNNEDSNRAK